MILYQDTETFSSVDLKTHGVTRYAEADDAEVMLWAYAVDEGEVQVWDRTETKVMPYELEKGLAEADEHVWQNFFFDSTMIATTMGIELPLDRTWDVMVQALAHGLPGGLDKLCQIYKIADEDAKQAETGRQMIQLFCKLPPKNHTRGRATRHTHPVEWQRFIEYAKSDIRSMRVLRHKLPTWNYHRRPSNDITEHQLWQLDQQINRRGVPMDLELARAALKAVADNKKVLDAQAEDWTGGDLRSATQRDALLAHLLEEYMVDLPDMKASTLERRMKDESLPQMVRDLLALRLETVTTSTAKYRKLTQVVSHDGCARGLLQFSGAARTRRDGGRLWQPQNLPRPTMGNEDIEDGIELLKQGAAPLVCAAVSKPGGKRLHEVSVPKLASNALRGSIVAPPGYKLVVSDLSNIEGVNGAYLTGEDWKLKAYAEMFADPTRPDMYQLSAAKTYGIPLELAHEIKGEKRQTGKVQELFLTYEGGVGAYITGAMTYKMDLDAVAANVLPILSDEAIRAARDTLAWVKRKRRSTYGLKDDTYVACEALKALWRAAHPAISSSWAELVDGAIRAIQSPGKEFEVRKLVFDKKGSWLRMLLPSGNYVLYPSAKAESVYERQDTGLLAGELNYQGVSPTTHQWKKIGTYGGKLLENADQSFSRDVLFYAMPAVEAAGYSIRMRVHDELITLAPDRSEWNPEHLSSILVAEGMSRYPGLPLKAAGFEAYRYKKEG